ncbi:hypothetical protein CPT_Magnus_037 [Klebsiella phage Magnus]|uniref:Uncharacterized protein n=1 Tax=Klebsiella phage Magnus TaxID=2589660 RepID=A0A5B9N5S0_9CAUD|nr:hypothetical protein HYP92_gp204 [Klebsiella phage Magnus]QEG07916.1 hypothetical protein CPT_Magnus_037 [Klebsiella phage Magnus]
MPEIGRRSQEADDSDEWPVALKVRFLSLSALSVVVNAQADARVQ